MGKHKKQRKQKHGHLIEQGIIWQNASGDWSAHCLTCGRERTFKTRGYACHAFISAGTKGCKRCASGKHKASNLARQKMSEARLKLFQSPEYVLKWINGLSRKKEITLSDGRKEFVQGYEPLTVNLLLSSSIPPEHIQLKVNEIPVIDYEYSGSHKYFPDCFISGSNLIVETKSTFTWLDKIGVNRAKISASVEQGYNIRVLVWNGKHELVSDMFFSKNTV